MTGSFDTCCFTCRFFRRLTFGQPLLLDSPHCLFRRLPRLLGSPRLCSKAVECSLTRRLLCRCACSLTLSLAFLLSLAHRLLCCTTRLLCFRSPCLSCQSLGLNLACRFVGCHTRGFLSRLTFFLELLLGPPHCLLGCYPRLLGSPRLCSKTVHRSLTFGVFCRCARSLTLSLAFLLSLADCLLRRTTRLLCFRSPCLSCQSLGLNLACRFVSCHTRGFLRHLTLFLQLLFDSSFCLFRRLPCLLGSPRLCSKAVECSLTFGVFCRCARSLTLSLAFLLSLAHRLLCCTTRLLCFRSPCLSCQSLGLNLACRFVSCHTRGFLSRLTFFLKLLFGPPRRFLCVLSGNISFQCTRFCRTSVLVSLTGSFDACCFACGFLRRLTFGQPLLLDPPHCFLGCYPRLLGSPRLCSEAIHRSLTFGVFCRGPCGLLSSLTLSLAFPLSLVHRLLRCTTCLLCFRSTRLSCQSLGLNLACRCVGCHTRGFLRRLTFFPQLLFGPPHCFLRRTPRRLSFQRARLRRTPALVSLTGSFDTCCFTCRFFRRLTFGQPLLLDSPHCLFRRLPRLLGSPRLCGKAVECSLAFGFVCRCACRITLGLAFLLSLADCLLRRTLLHRSTRLRRQALDLNLARGTLDRTRHVVGRPPRGELLRDGLSGAGDSVRVPRRRQHLSPARQPAHGTGRGARCFALG